MRPGDGVDKVITDKRAQETYLLALLKKSCILKKINKSTEYLPENRGDNVTKLLYKINWFDRRFKMTKLTACARRYIICL